MFLNHKRKPDINFKNKNGGIALHICAITDNVECAKILMKYNTNICERCKNGFLPIHLAAHSSANKVLKLLVDEGKINFISFLNNYY